MDSAEGLPGYCRGIVTTDLVPGDNCLIGNLSAQLL